MIILRWNLYRGWVGISELCVAWPTVDSINVGHILILTVVVLIVRVASSLKWPIKWWITCHNVIASDGFWPCRICIDRLVASNDRLIWPSMICGKNQVILFLKFVNRWYYNTNISSNLWSSNFFLIGYGWIDKCDTQTWTLVAFIKSTIRARGLFGTVQWTSSWAARWIILFNRLTHTSCEITLEVVFYSNVLISSFGPKWTNSIFPVSANLGTWTLNPTSKLISTAQCWWKSSTDLRALIHRASHCRIIFLKFNDYMI